MCFRNIIQLSYRPELLLGTKYCLKSYLPWQFTTAIKIFFPARNTHIQKLAIVCCGGIRNDIKNAFDTFLRCQMGVTTAYVGFNPL